MTEDWAVNFIGWVGYALLIVGAAIAFGAGPTLMIAGGVLVARAMLS